MDSMSTEDAREFGPIVTRLVGRECERTIAINTIKLRFGTESDPRGDSYIWVDPPWQLYSGKHLVTSSDEYDESTFVEWGCLFDPLNNVRFTGYEPGESAVVLSFENGYRIVIPHVGETRNDDDWYAHWYASEVDRKTAKGTNVRRQS